MGKGERSQKREGKKEKREGRGGEREAEREGEREEKGGGGEERGRRRRGRESGKRKREGREGGVNRSQSVSSSHEPLRRQTSSSSCRSPQPLSPQAVRHIWVRTALFEKVLDKIIQHIVDNSSKYYEKEALMHDPVYGPILAALLVGPCALEYTKLKTSDHFWTDPSANELVQRHRIHGAHRSQESTPGRRPALGIRKRQSSSSMSDDRFAASAREYVESLHQNSRTHLLYGKNNVLVQPKKEMEVLRADQRDSGRLRPGEEYLLDYALTVPLRQIVCLHCHQRPDCGGTLVLVSQDGIQRPPLLFPPGDTSWPSCPAWRQSSAPRTAGAPLWSQKGKGKVFPKLRKRSSAARLLDQDRPGDEETAADYVFRIVYPGYRYDAITINYHHSTGSRAPSLDDDEEEEDRLHAMISMICSRNLTHPNAHKDLSEGGAEMGGSPSSWQQSDVDPACVSCSSLTFDSSCSCVHDSADIHTVPLKMLCQNMKRQIVSRAFYGWLAYCRHLSTVRTHLSALVNHSIVPPDRPCEASGGLSREVWSKYQKDCKNYKELELLRLVYYGGVQHEIRKEVWPFLLGHYKFGMAKKDLGQVDARISERYQQVMREWKACELIVRQREKEMQSAIFAKLSSGSSIDSHVLRLVHRDSTLSNEVFMSVDEPDGGSQSTPSAEDTPPTTTTSTLLPPHALPPRSAPCWTHVQHRGGSGASEENQEENQEQNQEQNQENQTRSRTKDTDRLCSQLDRLVTNGDKAEKISPSLSSYTIELLDTVALNLHRIDKTSSAATETIITSPRPIWRSYGTSCAGFKEREREREKRREREREREGEIGEREREKERGKERERREREREREGEQEREKTEEERRGGREKEDREREREKRERRRREGEREKERGKERERRAREREDRKKRE
ncbi:hypothetical protein WMY93_028250 [Mugilogobius chulae]|uniref:RUN domain-containing protein n=1 Tax=Mugilogobius chulae TaxID=88201 RepID=A0AAW0MU15_9GOBI